MSWQDIPKFVTVGGVRWRIKRAKDLKHGDDAVYGKTEVDESEISLDGGKDLESQWRTLFHESCHAAFFMGGISEEFTDDREEAAIRCLENQLWPWLRNYIGRD